MSGPTIMFLTILAVAIFVFMVWFLGWLDAFCQYKTNDESQGDSRYWWLLLWWPVRIVNLILAPFIILLGMWAIYQQAKDMRDWFHAGKR